MSALKAQFEKYVGQVVEDPDREEYTICHTMQALESEAIQKGMAIALSKNGTRYEDEFSVMVGVRKMLVDLTQNDMNQWVIKEVRVPEV
jgi:hypothetical protein